MYKVAIIGAGVVGAMTARRLSAYEGEIVILEKEQDVAMGQSKANSGIVHAGFDPVPGSLKAEMNIQGSRMMEETCSLLGVGYRRNGSLVAAFSDEDCLTLKKLYERGIENGVEGLRILEGEEIFRIEKNLSRKIKKALYAPTGAVVCPYALTIEAAGCAMDNGARLMRSFEVEKIDRTDGTFVITAADGRKIQSRFVINCAGLYSDKIARMVGDDSFNITPRAGEYLLLDKEAAYLTDTTIFKVPDKMGKGVLAVALKIEKILIEQGFEPDTKENYDPGRPKRKIFAKCSVEEKNDLIKQDPSYGHVVCRCEEVTEAEIKEAIHRAPGAVDIDGIKRRTRSGMGRCQGGFCMPQVLEILARELGKSPLKITKKGGDSNILTGLIRGGDKDDLC